MPLSPKKLDELAESYLNQKHLIESEQLTLDRLRDRLVEAVAQSGHTPARANKTKALLGDLYEVRVGHPQEITVDTGIALRIRSTCIGNECRDLFRRLFNEVETFTLASGATKLINGPLPKRAPRNLRAMFARALSIKELSQTLDVRTRNKKSEAA